MLGIDVLGTDVGLKKWWDSPKLSFLGLLSTSCHKNS